MDANSVIPFSVLLMPMERTLPRMSNRSAPVRAGIGFEHGDRAVRDCGEAEPRRIPGYFVDGGPRVQVGRVAISETVAATGEISKAIRHRSLPNQSKPSFPRPLFAM